MPLREKSTECLSKQHDIAAHKYILLKCYGTLSKFADAFSKNPGQQTYAIIMVQLLKPFFEQYEKSQRVIAARTSELLSCSDTVEHLGHELATILGQNSEYDEMLERQRRRRKEIVAPEEGENIIAKSARKPRLPGALNWCD